MWLESKMIDFDLSRNDNEVRKELMKKSDEELIRKMQDVDQSIKAGFPYASYFQEWSIGIDILRQRGYNITRTNDIYNL